MHPPPVERDSRGILDPRLLQRRVRLTRYQPGPALEGLVDRFWAVEWELVDGDVHTQQVLTHPCANLSVGHADARGSRPWHVEARLNGVSRKITTRAMTGTGWTVAAMTTPGGLGAFVSEPATRFTDRVVPLGPALGVDDSALVASMSAAPDSATRAHVLDRTFQDVANRADPDRVRQARQVAAAARIAETDRDVRRLTDLSAATGVTARTLQRMFSRCAGVSPTWVLRRYRLMDAAEAVRNGRRVSWAELAVTLGYADQAHLTRDFRAALGTTPAAYAARVAER